MSKKTENQVIALAYEFFEGPNKAPFRERKPLLSDYHANGVEINGFVLQKKEDGVWVWKPTDIARNPEFKGEALLKIIPFTVPSSKVVDVLECQQWTYI